MSSPSSRKREPNWKGSEEISREDAGEKVVLEVGAGAGNTAFPVMKRNKNARLRLHACDFSKKAVDVIRNHPEYTSTETVGTLHASVWDIAAPLDPETSSPTLPEGIEPGTVDVVILIFIFSALAPDQWTQAVRNVWTLLKPGGIVLFRDYGRGDLAQVRFKKGRYMDENFYVRGDGTRVYFFEEEELRLLWGGETAESKPKDGEVTDDTNDATEGVDDSPSAEAVEQRLKRLALGTEGDVPRFKVLNFGVDRRMLVNRQRRLKMYRCWLQARFEKLEIPQ